MLSIAIQTLGCKLNQVESESIAEAFRREGFPLGEGDDADILVINTCTVTSTSEQKARRIIRKALRDHPHTCVIVTGCYAQLEGEAIAALDGSAVPDGPPYPGRRLFVVSGGRKSLLLDLPRALRDTLDNGLGDPFPGTLPYYLEGWLGQNVPVPDDGPQTPAFRFTVRDFSFHSRAFLKIQDGCDHACSYCRVSQARGPSVSLDAETVLSRLRELEAAGHGEAVLTGVNINQYRSDASGVPAGSLACTLGDLLEYLLANTRTIAIRLSSLEPDYITESFLRVLAHKRIRPHFHLSVQSGSPLILERMRRPYDPEAVEVAVRRLRDLRDDPFLACDIIAGFPGETPAEFAGTYELCRRSGFAWIHAFPYSPRPGTEAFDFTGAVAEREVVQRVEALINLARQGRAAYIRRWTGKLLEAIVEEGPRQGDPGQAAAITAVSENYLRLTLPLPPGAAPPPPGAVLRCRIREALEPPDAPFDAMADPVQEPV
jgi:threonylcarbamoyladenosine tRNA methylthiotransferase MtaB